MDFLKPPTDNLYKFMSIAGLLIAAFAMYQTDKAKDALATSIKDFQDKEDDRAAKVYSFAGPTCPPVRAPNLTKLRIPKADIDWINAAGKDRDTWALFVDGQITIHDECRQPFQPADIDRYFKRPEVHDYFVAAMKWPDKDYSMHATSMTLKQFTTLHKTELAMYQDNYEVLRRHAVTLQHIWKLIDRYNSVWWRDLLIVAGGCAFAGIGFRLWQTRVQKIEDDKLAIELQLARKKLTQPGTDAT